ncbi:spore maturation protein [Laceyella sacchari]|jgi:spore maturation protein B|uniref:Spore maturation protein B n=3 Tax=Laceyella TaxID=292635 RepID=A0AA45WPD1_9BACL|nr:MULTISPECIES: nucleoside recognition domain-containing protein [Laceyella]KPC68142.1 spore maturation protein [Thermoactinomyces vulgaris]AUS08660.1 spore maturation protein [Laceyella sacchari]MRG28294.1 spore maturation protein [Laceyella tengchongensis]PRZ14421.1 spore maturation protein B [Laceyella sediminis]TCW41323.1 spore maturation protein B [Laceyella sacchari]
MFEAVSLISKIMLPALLVFIPLYALFQRVPIYESFIEGAKEGFPTAVSIIPHLVGMMVAVAIFRDTGAMQFYLQFLTPVLSFFHIPEEVVPIGILRPISGTGSLAFVESILRTHGPDTFLGKLASTIQGSTDTTLYVLTVYFGAVGIRNSLYALKVGLWADLIGFLASLGICSILYL